jgi:hypothetical protein
VIERVVLHQSRFRTPGLVPDPRGVALGPLGIVLLASAERLVSFLRATGEEGALDELLDSLRIVQVVSPLRTREMVVEVQASSSHRMDRLASIARLVGGLVFTGSGRHFVKYRDAQAPFGYDIGELLAEPGDMALYHDRFAQPYKLDRTIAIRDLVLRLAPVHVPRSRAENPRLAYALARIGLGESLVGYLARWSVPARVARIEWQRGGTSDVIEQAYLLQLTGAPARFIQLLRSLPGVQLFVPDGERAVVEYGYRHPIPLSACTPLFGTEELVLFRSGGEGAVVLAQRPPFVDVQAVTTLSATAAVPAQNVKIRPIEGTFSLPLRLVASSTPPRRVAAVVIPSRDQDTLGRMLSVLPPAALSRLTCAFTEHAVYVYGTESAPPVPLGVLYEELGDGVFVPLGTAMSPPIPPDVLRQLARAEARVRLFVTGGNYPITAIPESAFVPATRILVTDIPVYEDAPVAPPLDADRPLPDVWPSPPGVFAGLTTPGARGALPTSRQLGGGDGGDGSDVGGPPASTDPTGMPPEPDEQEARG